MQNLRDAREELKQAEQNFNWADPDYVDIAIMQINIAEKKAEVASGKVGRPVLPWLKREAV
jgi:hypothetical protein